MDARRLPLPSPLLGIPAGLALAAAALLVMLPLRHDLGRATPALVLVIPGVAAGVLGGRLAAAVVAAATALAFDLLFLPPYGQLKIFVTEDVVAVVVFVVSATTVGEIAAREAVRRRVAEARATELEMLGSRLESAQAEQGRMQAELARLEIVEQVDQQRAALLRSVSHDLRTPLATIRAVSSDLRSDTPYDDATRDELLGLVSDEAERLDRLVSNLLSMSRIEAGVLTPDRQAVDLPELIAATVNRLDRLLLDKRVEVAVPADLPLVDADYTQLDQVITNLLENAVRHSVRRSTVRVGARAATDRVEVWVQDEGQGVPTPDRSRIFEPFRRGYGSRSSGIGLAICKAVVEAHGGTIDVSDAVGGGARFTFTVPVWRRPPTAERSIDPRG
ncbi:MAG: kdpD [Acidimicrobiales bacterium]|nr:kdpD [Acidimicrobiales bacterium]